MEIKDLTEYVIFENALKNLINKIDSDIIDINIFAKKSTKNLEVNFNKKEKLNTILK